MAISTYKLAAVVAFFFLSLTLLPFQSGGSWMMEGEVRRKTAVGSRPPACVKRCMSCTPCEATLVILSHDRGIFVKSSHAGDDDAYYLLSWKCRCGSKFYPP